jgi:hypothetical protein
VTKGLAVVSVDMCNSRWPSSGRSARPGTTLDAKMRRSPFYFRDCAGALQKNCAFGYAVGRDCGTYSKGTETAPIVEVLARLSWYNRIR